MEAYVLASGVRAISLAQLEQAVARDLEVATGNFMFAVQQMAWRSKVLAAAYPFELTDSAIAHASPRPLHAYYEALLLLTQALSSKFGPWPTEFAALLFERVVCVALGRFFGEGTEVLRFGWPYEAGRPEHFADAIKWAAEKMRLRLGAGYRHPRRRDGGVDVIAWHPFPDSRPGFPIALVQCTIEDDVVGKSRDIDLRLWSTWLGFDTAPMAVLAVPSTIGRNEDWNEVATNSVLLERLRLVALCARTQTDPETQVSEFAARALGSVRERLGVRV